MKIIKINDLDSLKDVNFVMKTLFDGDVKQKRRLFMGIAQFPPGARVPIEGESTHDGDEYAILLKGTAKIVSGGREYRMSAGEASFIPAGEAHWSLNDGETDSEVVWVLVTP